MALEDRERNFEKALRRELRRNDASGLDCPDAETLAAYHERMLSPEEMSAQKTHIAACPRCQEILATVEMTEAIPSGAQELEKVPAKTKELEAARAKTAQVREMPKRKAYLRWAASAGAIAAGLLVWIAINTARSPMTMKQNAKVQVAENRGQKEAPVSTPKPETKTPAASSPMTDMITKDDRSNSKRESEAFSVGDLERTQSKTQDETMSRGRASAVLAPRPSSHGPRQLQNQANQTQNQMLYQNQNNGQVAAQNQAMEFDKLAGIPITGKNATGFEQNGQRRNEKAMKAEPAAPSPAPPPVPAAGAAGGAVSRADAEESKDQKIGAVSETVEVTGEAPRAFAEEKAGDSAAAHKKLKETQSTGLIAANLRDGNGLGFVRTPDSKVFWVFTANGMVFKTEDGGNTTRAQKIGSGMKLLAGSAPDAKTCWLLAEKGIVLRTKDGGKKWITVNAPSDGNFTMITGLDAVSALVTDASGRVSYSTADGGATWKVVPQK